MIDFVFACVVAQHRRQLYCIIRGVDGSFMGIDINYIRPRYYTHIRAGALQTSTKKSLWCVIDSLAHFPPLSPTFFFRPHPRPPVHCIVRQTPSLTYTKASTALCSPIFKRGSTAMTTERNTQSSPTKNTIAQLRSGEVPSFNNFS